MPDQPNVVFLISDQHKQAVAGCYGNTQVQTPNIDSLSRDGATFEHAFCQSPLCGPSRGSILTGAYPHTTGLWTHRQPVPIRYLPTMGHVFRDAGYATGAIGKVHVKGEGPFRDLGFDERALRYYTYDYKDYIDAIGLDKVKKYVLLGNAPEDYLDQINRENQPIDLDEGLMYDTMVVDRSIDFIKEHSRNPFLLWVGLEKPHPYWYAPERFHQMYDPADMAVPDSFAHPPKNVPKTVEWAKGFGKRFTQSEEVARAGIASYYANVSYMDEQVGRVLRTLEELDLADNTIVIYTTDHGEHLFEHRMIQKHCFYEAAVRVPLLIRWPGRIPPGERAAALVELLDLFPTLTDLCGIAAPDTLEGATLAPLLRDPSLPHKQAVFSELYCFKTSERMVRTDKWKYVHTEGDLHQLYDLEADPLELENLAATKGSKALCQGMDALVCEHWELPSADMLIPPD